MFAEMLDSVCSLKEFAQVKVLHDHLPVQLKTTVLSRSRCRTSIMKKASEFLNKTEEDQSCSEEAMVVTKDRHSYKESLRNYMTKQREMFHIQYSLSVKHDTMKKMEEIVANEKRKLRLAEKHLEEDAITFDNFLKENDLTSVEAVKIAEQETRIKLEKANEIKRASAKMMAIKSIISKNEEILNEYLLYKDFLTNMTPSEWKKEQQRKKDKKKKAKIKERDKKKKEEKALEPAFPKTQEFALLTVEQKKETQTRQGLYCVTKISVYYQELELYFKDPKEMLNILTELEEQNLSYIQNFQETEEAMEEMRTNVRITKERMNYETEILKQQIVMLKATIVREEEKASELEFKSRIFSYGEVNSQKQDHALNILNKKVDDVYKSCIGDVPAKISTLQMLTSIENRMEELLESLEALPRDKVEAVEHLKEKEMRLRIREEQIRIKKQQQEERLRTAIQRANADTKKRAGRKLMFRSEPPTIKQVNKSKGMTTKEQEDLLYYFT
ncbi:cilia- and flagella-associated protein 100-like [Polyodon spathula]|uniref:cilia- and flagella-associated protein 100-like n=1 Tax=Polyodon spathula TaxID=7913 RepID=UPI001B7EC557|nr:cilia- and flagella-associated protein 100-like [Polyodon spathula]